MKIDTVKIVREDSERGFRIIAASDFDSEVHSLFEEPAESPEATGNDGESVDPNSPEDQMGEEASNPEATGNDED